MAARTRAAVDAHGLREDLPELERTIGRRHGEDSRVQSWTIRRENYEAFTSQALVAALNAELLDRYDGFDGSGGEHAASDFEPPDGYLRRRLGRRGAGRLRRRHAATTRRPREIRRMYVAPGRARARPLAAPARRARGRGDGSSATTLVRLETGDRQPEAIKLYVSSGFEPIPRFGPFVDDPRSVCFEKRL